jgi:hypothetical protein
MNGKEPYKIKKNFRIHVLTIVFEKSITSSVSCHSFAVIPF